MSKYENITLEGPCSVGCVEAEFPGRGLHVFGGFWGAMLKEIAISNDFICMGRWWRSSRILRVSKRSIGFIRVLQKVWGRSLQTIPTFNRIK